MNKAIVYNVGEAIDIRVHYPAMVKPLLPSLIVAQTNHEATCYTHYRNSISKSSNYMCIIYYGTNAIVVRSCLKCLASGSTGCTYCKMY